MANKEQRAKLNEGAKAWNEWRRSGPREAIDLSRADLSGANLNNANLSDAELSYANLSRARLSGSNLRSARLPYTKLNGARLNRANLEGAKLGGAILSYADLSGADLRSANLRSARLFDANLRSADLSRADLEKAMLTRADLSGAALSNANLGGALLLNTVFGDTDLSDARNLDQCKFPGPSTIDGRTLRRSGSLPDDFLKGCGLSDWEIEAAKLHQEGLSTSQIEQIAHDLASIRLDQTPIQFYSCFVSYNSEDERVARRIHEALDKKGVRSWFAPEDLKIGARFRQVIADEIRTRDKLLVILSANSIESPEVAREVRRGLREEDKTGRIILFPIRLDDSISETEHEWAEELQQERHIGDFRDWESDSGFSNAFDRLVRDLEKAVE